MRMPYIHIISDQDARRVLDLFLCFTPYTYDLLLLTISEIRIIIILGVINEYPWRLCQ